MSWVFNQIVNHNNDYRRNFEKSKQLKTETTILRSLKIFSDFIVPNPKAWWQNFTQDYMTYSITTYCIYSELDVSGTSGTVPRFKALQIWITMGRFHVSHGTQFLPSNKKSWIISGSSLVQSQSWLNISDVPSGLILGETRTKRVINSVYKNSM